MDILFLTVVEIKDLSDSGIYTDLIQKFCEEGHNVFAVCPFERRLQKKTQVFSEKNFYLLKIRIPNIQKTNLVEKGIATLLIEPLYLWGIKKYYSNIKFDLVIYSTPPITYIELIDYIKKRYRTISYLLLKDIFPQNAVDLGLLKKNSLLYKYFRNKEKRLYAMSDYIGCMSPANELYLRTHNPDLLPSKIEVNPNSISINKFNVLSKITRASIRRKNHIPIDSIIFIYGGNLGRPQGIDFLINILNYNRFNKNAFFLIIGSGTEYMKIWLWIEDLRPSNVRLIQALPKEEYDSLVQCADVGLVFLDKRFTIPNFPSRLLSYLENGMPVIAATDIATDLGTVLEDNRIGFWLESGDTERFNEYVDRFVANPSIIQEMGGRGYNYLKNNYSVDHSYNIIMKHFQS